MLGNVKLNNIPQKARQISKPEGKNQVTYLLKTLSYISFAPHEVRGIIYDIDKNDNMHISVLFHDRGRYTNDSINIPLSNLSIRTKRKIKFLFKKDTLNEFSYNYQIQNNCDSLVKILQIIKQDL